MTNEQKEQVLQHITELNDVDRVELFDRMAGDEDGDPVEMFVCANMVMSSDQFHEAKDTLELRGYGTEFVGI